MSRAKYSCWPSSIPSAASTRAKASKCSGSVSASVPSRSKMIARIIESALSMTGAAGNSGRGRARSSKQRDDLALRRRRAHLRAPALDRHVEFAAHAETAGQIDAGLDRKAGAVDEHAMVVGFERVEVGAGAVHLAPDRMAGAMHEPLAVAGALDRAARGAVGLFAAHRLAGRSEERRVGKEC